MSTRHDVTGQVVQLSGQQVRRKLKASHKVKGFKMKPGFIYTVVRAISARVNQNYDGWPSSELKKAAHTFVGKPVFVNHENEDPTKARGVVVAARYIENGNDKYIECIQEIDARRFPKLAHEIKSGGLDSVSMGAEAGFTICSYCGNKAVDEPDFCDHVKYHKGQTLPRFNRKTGRKEDVLVYESCHKLGFFELSYVFDPADETSVATKVLVASVKPDKGSDFEQQVLQVAGRDIGTGPGRFMTGPTSAPWLKSPRNKSVVDTKRRWQAEPQQGEDEYAVPEDRDPFDPRSYEAAVLRTAGMSKQAIADCPPGENCERPVPDGSNGEQPNPSGGGAAAAGGGAGALPNPAGAPGAVGVPSSGGGIPLIRKPDGTYTSPDPAWAHLIDRESGGRNIKQSPSTHDVNSGGNEAFGLFQITPGTWTSHGGQGSVYDSTPEQQATVAADIIRKNPSGSDWGAGLAGREDPAALAAGASGKPAQTQPTQPTQQQAAPTTKDAARTFEAAVLEAAESPAPENARHTQRPGTIGTYRAVHKYFDDNGAPNPMGTAGVLDYGAGLGHSGQWGHTYEPYPREGFQPTYHTSEEVPEGQFHRVTNLNVLNVVPPNVRDQIVDGIGRSMAPGGHAVITTRGRDVYDAANLTPVKWDPGPLGPGVIVNKGRKDETYQKGFHPDELHSYVRDRLGDGFDVKKVGIGSAPAAVHIVKRAGSKQASFEQQVLRLAGIGDEHSDLPWALDGYKQHRDNTYGGVDSPHAFDHYIDQLNNSMGGLGGDDEEKLWSYVKNRIDSPGLGPWGLDRQDPHGPYPKGEVPGGKYEVPNALLPGNRLSFKDEVLHMAGYTEAGAHSRTDEGGRHRDDRPWLERTVDRTPLEGLQVWDANDWAKAHPAPPKDENESSFVASVLATAGYKQAWGEQEAPTPVDTLREEGSAPDDDTNDFEHYVEPPDILKAPDLSQAAQVDREQEDAGAGPEEMGGQPPQQGGDESDNGQYMVLKIPVPQPQQGQIPQQDFSSPAPPVPGPPPGPPQPQQAPPGAGAVQASRQFENYFRQYYGHRVDTTLGNTPAVHSTSRNPRKGTTMANGLVDRGRVASRGRRQHFAADTSGHTDGGPYGRNDEGEQEEAFINSVFGEGVPPEEPVEAPTDDTPNISNTENNLVARVRAGREQLLRDAKQLAAVRSRTGSRRTAEEVAEVVDPQVQTGPAGEALTGDHFESANPDDGVVETQPKNASLEAFANFDRWLARESGYRARDLREAAIKKAAEEYSVRSGSAVQSLFPALGIVLREARKNEAAFRRANRKTAKGAPMRKRADEKLEVAAPDARIDVEAPVANETDADAQSSQFNLRDFGNNAGDNKADPDLSTKQNWAPGEGQKNSSRARPAGELLAMRCAEAMIEAGLEPNNRNHRYQLAQAFANMNRGLVLDRIAMAERFVQVREADHKHAQKVASGSTRGATRSPVPLGLTQGVARTASTRRTSANDPANDPLLFG